MRLSSNAIRILEILKQDKSKTIQQFEREGIDQATVNRAILELEQNKLIETDEKEEITQKITEKGKKIIENGSPEFNIIKQLDQGLTPISELKGDTDIGVGKAKQKNWIEIESGDVSKTEKGQKIEDDPVKRQLEQKDFNEDLKDRGLVQTIPEKIKTLKLTEKGQETDLDDITEEFDVEADTKELTTGKKHYYKEILNYARQTWLEMGFEEMGGDYVVPSLLNFDALYTPQDHPARELHDTFFVEKPEKSDLSKYGDKVERIKQTHQNGWETGSKGYGGDWSKEEAEKNVVRTHTTAISAQRLHQIDINEEELPKKFFMIGRNFRNETVDRTHLAEFYQTDGIVVGRNLNFKHLKSYISEFFEQMGYEKFRLIPSYYPYTEMSVEVQIWDEKAEEWMGLGGAGMFRPEVVKPLLGFEARVLAWGLGIPRIAFVAADLEDIRELYRNDIKIIDDVPVWRPEWNNSKR